MNNLSEATHYIKMLRDMGFAVVVFTSEELRGAIPDLVEDRLIELGWDVIASHATENDRDLWSDEDLHRTVR